MSELFTVLLIAVAAIAAVFIFIYIPLSWRRIAKANEVHIVQSGKKTKSFGNNTENGNTYYAWPSWIPFIGVTTSVLPLNNFQLDIEDYVGMDSGRIPFYADVRAFFRVSDSNKAAQRISSFQELKHQLQAIIEGAARAVFAQKDIEEILSGRKEIGKAFTDEVDDKLSNEFGVVVIGSVELMDIRDAEGSEVILKLMGKKQSQISMESTLEVAANRKKADIAQIEADREVQLQRQEANQTIGLRKVQAEREVALSEQEKQQAISETEKVTREKQMAVLEIESVKQAEITKKIEVTKAEQQKEVTILAAEADLETKKKLAEGIAAEGKARAETETAMHLAPVTAQTTLAKDIGSQKEYQEYLIRIEKVKADRDIGIESAKALSNADIKIIANSGDAGSGLKSAMDIFSSKGGIQVGAMLEGLANTDSGKALLEKFDIQKGE